MKADFESPYCHVTSDDLLIILDSGCSIAITPDIGAFIDGTYLPQEHGIKGIGSGLNSPGIGEVDWKFLDINGKTVMIRLTCLHVPAIPCRLLPPQQVASQGNSKLPEGAWIGHGKLENILSQGHVINFPYDPSSNLPSCKMAPDSQHFCTFIAQATGARPAPSVPTKTKIPSSATPNNLTSRARTLLSLDHHFGHRSFNDIQTWAQEGRFNIPIEVSKCIIPTCLACKFGKVTKCPLVNATDKL
jgi:hypothetical protein